MGSAGSAVRRKNGASPSVSKEAGGNGGNSSSSKGSLKGSSSSSSKNGNKSGSLHDSGASEGSIHKQPPAGRAGSMTTGIAAERADRLDKMRSKTQNDRVRSPSFEKAVLQETEAKPEKTFKRLQEELRANTFFSGHSTSQLDDMARFMKRVDVVENQIVVKFGDVAREFFIIERGNFEMIEGPIVEGTPTEAVAEDATTATTTASPDKKKSLSSGAKSPRILNGSGSFGESGLRFKENYKFSVRAKTEGTLWMLSAGKFQAIVVKESIARESQFADFLRRVPILAQLTDEQLNAVGMCLTRHTYEAGEKIITQGTSGSVFYILEKGRASAYQRTQKGDKQVVTLVNSFGPGDYFGEGALLEDAPRNADVIAEEPKPGDAVNDIPAGPPASPAKKGTSLTVKKAGKSKKFAVSCLALRREDFVDLLGGLQKLLDTNFTARVLKAVDLLSSLTDAERAEIADHLVQQKYEDESVIIKQGDAGDKFFIIKEGEVLFKRLEPGKTEAEEIGRLFNGQVFGEGALLTDEPRRATAYAVASVTLLSLDRSVFATLFNESLQEMLNRAFAKRRDKTMIEFPDLQALKVLGRGTYGEVLLMSHKVTGATYALKCLKKKKVVEMEQQEHVANERAILELVQNHPFVVQLVQTFSGQTHVFALMEAVLGGELFAYMRSVGKLSVKDTLFYVAQVILVFEYLHSNNIIYRDLKPENILLSAEGYCKVTDFGLSKHLGESGKTYTLCGTPAYAAPEVYNLSGHGKAVDWWGLGTLVHELISGTTPFDGDAAAIFASMEQYARAYPNIRLPKGLEGDAGEFVLLLLHPSPSKRLGSMPYGVRGVKAHNVLKGFQWSELQKFALPAPYKPQIKSMYDTRNFYEPVAGDAIDLTKIDPTSLVPNAPWKF